ncbi:60S ribosomal protein L2, mitochondrial [Yamadazyma tenuis ATCC 10573]|uniref:Large ribosomal subunit protein bL27m n=1 Tax=Candida tenuis (strain ATCC 10573 / BCRC 21748 / CBS 615 / JCM 9827 / NBRC 10315 / NRRL Y-1498 / VKM Y-70) TaxID=590646 RepID=G3AWM3_CANTC|nr:60S ribosomal protein L2, mitochondrial [Yamadazyma tenuis ATCC 10573]EGV66570.1 60S ribosomal protein L2, mitochondrial [Yamadazyma tenuis ATCC 10573]
MSLFKSTVGYIINLTQKRNATKRASGSRTNKNDSAGRRLGPKVHESNFVNPGQIIMRQRGTKIHPGENTGIGKDHTIFALEPGYVRFYYDPFHPLRKYVGIALKEDLTLPTPHFSPRVRRFGYVEISDPVEAKTEESRMSRQEYLQQPELQKIQARNLAKDQELIKRITEQISTFLKLNDAEKIETISSTLLHVHKLTKLGLSVEEANLQTKFNYLYELKLRLRRGEIEEGYFSELKDKYIALVDLVNSKITIDINGGLCQYLSPEQRSGERINIISRLNNFKDKLISQSDQQVIKDLIKAPLIFTKVEQASLEKEFLPSILPETVEGTVVTDVNTKKVPKNMFIVKKFDNDTRQVKVIGRTREAFLK